MKENEVSVGVRERTRAEIGRELTSAARGDPRGGMKKSKSTETEEIRLSLHY